MKNRILSLLLVLVLLVAVSAFAVDAVTYAAATEGMETVTGDLTFRCAHCKADVLFTEWDGTNGGGGLEVGHCYVPYNVTMTQNVDVSKLHLYIAADATVDTAGYTLTLNNTTTDATESELVITGTGKLLTTSAVSPITYTEQKGSVYLVGATIDVSGATARAAELLYADNSFVINTNGTVIGVSAAPDSAYEGGSIRVVGGTLTLTKGTITGGHAKLGGNVYVGNGGTFNMDGGTVSHGVVTYHGGNVYLASDDSSAKAKMTMDGGTVEAGQASKNGGNIGLNKVFNFTMNGGTLTANDSDGSTNGSANNGLNIAANSGGTSSYNGSVIALNGGTIAGTYTEDGGGVWFWYNTTSGVRTAARVGLRLGNVTFQNDTDYADIYTCNYGRVEVQEGYTNSVVITSNNSPTTATYDPVTIMNLTRVVHDGSYVDTGKVTMKYGENVYNLVGWNTSDGKYAMAVANAAIFDGASVVTPYATVADAIAATMTTGQYVKLYEDNATLALTQDTTVDFNGHTTTVTRNGYTLTGMDSQTDDYTAAGAATVTFTDGDPASINNVVELTIGGVTGTRKYLYLDGGFHRYYLSIDKTGLRSADNDGDKTNPGIMYNGVYRGDETVLANMTAYGVKLASTPYTYGTAPATTAKTEGKMLAVHGWLTEEYNAVALPAQAYITVAGETIYSTNTVSESLKTLTEGFVADYSAGNLADTFCSVLESMIDACKTIMEGFGWNVTLTKPEAAA